MPVTPNTQVVVQDYGDKTLVFEVCRTNKDKLEIARTKPGPVSIGRMRKWLHGNRQLHICRIITDGNVTKQFKGSGDSFGDFVNAVRNDVKDHTKRPADIIEGHLFDVFATPEILPIDLANKSV